MGSFERDLRKAFESAANAGVQKVGTNMQAAFDSVYRTHKGKPVSQVRPALRSALRGRDFTPDTKQLESWAKAISDGTKIVVDVEKVRF